MLKVVIADDEERIVMLIRTLIDWDGIGLELAGVAQNGIDARRLVEETAPDILITDIRMPGCSGLELIEEVKKTQPGLEIIIISGYAHFEYARQAIKYGVGDYLLKPINKKELCDTLGKLKQHIQERSAQAGTDRTDNRTETEILRQRKNLLVLLAEEKAPLLSENILKDVYHMNIGEGLFQTFQMRLDFGPDAEPDSSVQMQMDRIRDVMERELTDLCRDCLFASREYDFLGLLHYGDRRQEDIRRAMRRCLGQVEMQRNLFRKAKITLGLGPAVADPQQLGASMREAGLLIRERLLKGTGRMLEKFHAGAALPTDRILEKYMRQIDPAVESLDETLSDQAVDLLQREIAAQKEWHGFELLDLVHSAIRYFLMKLRVDSGETVLARALSQSEQCSGADELWNWMKEFQRGCLEKLRRERESDAVRPVRKAKQYIASHYRETITLEEVSEYVGLSPAYFSALFKKTEGVGFAKYLMNMRVEQAKTLLRESNLPVAAICRKVGYNDLKHFTQIFEKAAGIKPSAYRKLYG